MNLGLQILSLPQEDGHSATGEQGAFLISILWDPSNCMVQLQCVAIVPPNHCSQLPATLCCDLAVRGQAFEANSLPGRSPSLPSGYSQARGSLSFYIGNNIWAITLLGQFCLVVCILFCCLIKGGTWGIKGAILLLS